jgi:hypothetical protein
MLENIQFGTPVIKRGAKSEKAVVAEHSFPTLQANVATQCVFGLNSHVVKPSDNVSVRFILDVNTNEVVILLTTTVEGETAPRLSKQNTFRIKDLALNLGVEMVEGNTYYWELVPANSITATDSTGLSTVEVDLTSYVAYKVSYKILEAPTNNAISEEVLVFDNTELAN